MTYTDVLPEKRFPVNAVKDAKNSIFFKAVKTELLWWLLYEAKPLM